MVSKSVAPPQAKPWLDSARLVVSKSSFWSGMPTHGILRALDFGVCALSRAHSLRVLPRAEELGTNSYIGASFVRGTSLGVLELTLEKEWPLSITYVGEDTLLCRYEGAGGEPSIQRDGVPL
ncbi:hypothetical protein AMTR_s00043p00208200 [Amborella trichopoda]|uniref:Uncharacterized protein n=1 Tax=Amborella trichopoda TaxID=13333 RepID=W1PXQ5_AMBTC|nr:hypothetical protein AMTR_s00043p00208200 [Amborella trichopoda]